MLKCFKKFGNGEIKLAYEGFGIGMSTIVDTDSEIYFNKAVKESVEGDLKDVKFYDPSVVELIYTDGVHHKSIKVA